MRSSRDFSYRLSFFNHFGDQDACVVVQRMAAAEDDKKRPVTSETELVPDGVAALATGVVAPPKTKKPKVIKRKYKVKELDATAPMGVLQQHIRDILLENGLTEDDISNDMKLILNDKDYEKISHRRVNDVKITSLSSSGDGLALISHPHISTKKQICTVPFGLPGDIVNIRVFKSHPTYVEADLLEVVQASEFRDDSRINCKYFGKCSGCQFQSVDYKQQLIFKRQIIENAYKHLAPTLSAIEGALPPISKTKGSPKQYDYRTKLTPHFNLPYKIPLGDYPAPPLGFGAKGRPKWRGEKVEGGDLSVLDIEECSIGTEIINIGMHNERQVYHREYKKYRKGATILLREDTILPSSDAKDIIGSRNDKGEVSKIEVEVADTKLTKTCVTDPRQIVTEFVNGFTFEFSAGEFFQNNNSILPAVIEHVRNNLVIPPIVDSTEFEASYLVDAYCGSGLFSITCSAEVSKVIGVEVSADSVKFAERNAMANKISNAKFIHGKAEKIFGEIDTPAERTSVILDPPRKGCDDVFLNQLSDYNPAKIVYISCNVHSQARDIDWFITNTSNGSKYTVESIKGFDFFPQTHHVESVAVLSRK